MQTLPIANDLLFSNAAPDITRAVNRLVVAQMAAALRASPAVDLHSEDQVRSRLGEDGFGAGSIADLADEACQAAARFV